MTYPGRVLTHDDFVDLRRQRLDELRDAYERKPASAYRTAALEAFQLAADVITDCDETLRSSEATWQRAYDRQQHDLDRARSLTALSELRAVPEDDDTKVRVTLEPPTTGLRVGHLQAAYLSLMSAGAHDWSPLDTVATRDSYGHRWSAVVQNPNVVDLRLPEQMEPGGRPTFIEFTPTTPTPRWMPPGGPVAAVGVGAVGILMFIVSVAMMVLR